MLRAQTGESGGGALLHLRRLLLVAFAAVNFGCAALDPLIVRGVRPLEETPPLVVALQDSHAEAFAVGSHLGDLDAERPVDDEINLAVALQDHVALRRAILLGDAALGKRIV
jgi:hypothetical protein